MTVRFDTQPLKLPVLFPTQPFVRRLAHKGTHSVSILTLTMFFVRTSKQPVLVLTVFLKVCDAHSGRTSELPHVFAEDSESSRSTAMQQTT